MAVEDGEVDPAMEIGGANESTQISAAAMATPEKTRPPMENRKGVMVGKG